jgi:hypothetical protein
MQNLIVNNVLIKEISLYYGTLFLTEGEDTEMLIEHETNIIPLKNDVMFGIEFSLITDDSSNKSQTPLQYRIHCPVKDDKPAIIFEESVNFALNVYHFIWQKLDSPQEMVGGIWKIEVLFEDQLLICQTFDVRDFDCIDDS